MELEYVELRDLITHLFLQHALKFYSLVFDAVYTPKMTRLLKEAEESGATIVKGLEMFIGQAYEQYEKYTGLPGKPALRGIVDMFHGHFGHSSIVPVSVLCTLFGLMVLTRHLILFH
jgi:hypothetical protein